jgi:hypothetical protein
VFGSDGTALRRASEGDIEMANHAARCAIVVLAAVMAGCSGSSSVSDYMSGSPEGYSPDMSAEFVPVIAVAAMGGAQQVDPIGTEDDRLGIGFMIRSLSYEACGIDPSNGFNDETVSFHVKRADAEIFTTPVPFGRIENLSGREFANFGVGFVGASFPRFKPGDTVELTINGILVFNGTFATM